MEVVTAFQRHFRPARVDGVADHSTMTTLHALLASLPADADDGRGEVVRRQIIRAVIAERGGEATTRRKHGSELALARRDTDCARDQAVAIDALL